MSDIAKAIDNLKRVFAEGNAMKLRELGNSFLSKAAMENNRLFAELSVIAYCLHKMLSKEHIVKNENWASSCSKTCWTMCASIPTA